MKTIYVKEMGIHSGEDVTVRINELLEANPTDTEFVFEKGTYYFTPKYEYPYSLSNTNNIDIRKISMWLKNMKNITLDFGGSNLLFSGHMNALTCDNCENLTIKNAVIDWPEPLVAEGIVTGFSDDHIDLFIDSKKYPHEFVPTNGLKFYYGNGESNYLWASKQYEKSSRTVVKYRDGSINFFTNVKYLGNDIYRFEAKNYTTQIGNILVLRHNLRHHAGVFLEKCSDVLLTDVTFHSTCGIGCLAQFCENLTFNRVFFTPNREAGRYISGGRDDGIHVTSTKGTVLVNECTFFGLMDDPINIHGCSVIAESIIDNRTIRCRYGHDESHNFKYWAEEGNDISFIDRKHMNSVLTRKAVSFTPEDIDHFVLVVDEPVDEDILKLMKDDKAIALENLTNTSTVTVTNNRFGSGQGRGMLISTPKPVKIQNNYFESSGSAILVAGDANEWFESGECHDIEISGNVFSDNCLSSIYQFCEGVISICPVIPEPDTDKPFHKNIYIHDNLFDSADTPILYAFSCDGLRFTQNRIMKSPTEDTRFGGKAMIKLRYSRNVEILDNKYIGLFGLDKYDVEECENILKD